MSSKRPAGGDRLRFIDFELPTLVDKAPEGDDWSHEVKWDGYRTELVIQGGRAQAFTRRGFDWTSKYGPIADLAAALPVKSAIVDGEVVVLDQHRSNMAALRLALGRFPERLVFVAFDLLHLDGEDLRRLPTTERRARLQEILPTDGGPIQFSQHVTGGGREFFAAAEKMELEGIVSKRADAPYRSGRQPTWLKTKCFEISTYEVAGVLREPGRPAVAYMVTPDRERRYVGGAFITLANAQRERLWKRVQAKAKPPAGFGKPKAGTEWLRPGQLARVKHLKGEDELRHASLTELDE
jgi:DNA ligase D-like protein (predicted ligase)